MNILEYFCKDTQRSSSFRTGATVAFFMLFLFGEDALHFLHSPSLISHVSLVHGLPTAFPFVMVSNNALPVLQEGRGGRFGIRCAPDPIIVLSSLCAQESSYDSVSAERTHALQLGMREPNPSASSMPPIALAQLASKVQHTIMET